MKNELEAKRHHHFQSIQVNLLDRLADEAEQRTLVPQEVDWEEIHRQAALARKES